MAIDLTKTFGRSAAPVANGSRTADVSERKKANFWLNFGYSVPVRYQDGSEETRFVSLPVGIPLDTMEITTPSRGTDEYRSLIAAGNDLHQQIMDVAVTLQPGEERIICADQNNGLSIQIRRVKADAPPIANAENLFARKLDLAGVVG